jgi:methyl-accepting chemotaxis protein
MRSEVESARAAAEEEARLVAVGVATVGKTEQAFAAIEAAARSADLATSSIQEATNQQRETISETADSIWEVRHGFDALAEEGQRNNREAKTIREVVSKLNDVAGFVERTVHEQKAAAEQIAASASRSLTMMHEIQDAVENQKGDSSLLHDLLAQARATGRETLESAALVEDAAEALERMASSLENEAGRFRAGTSDGGLV